MDLGTLALLENLVPRCEHIAKNIFLFGVDVSGMRAMMVTFF